MKHLVALVLVAAACGDDTVGPPIDAPVGDVCLCDAPIVDAPPDAPPADAATDAAPLGRMVAIPAGSFMMGCNTAIDNECGADEYPYHAVSLSAYEIDRYEVTQAEYQACVAATTCTLPAANFDGTSALPVRDASWDQARAYCVFAGKHLPTEAQWEYAARGGDGRKYPWGSTPAPDCVRANFVGCGGAPLAADRDLGTSPFLLQDVAGNVWEWVGDFYDANYYAQSPAMDPPGPTTGTDRVARGGSYVTSADTLRTSNRIIASPSLPYDDIGFRCAR